MYSEIDISVPITQIDPGSATIDTNLRDPIKGIGEVRIQDAAKYTKFKHMDG